MEIVKTDIDGLVLRINKVVKDNRGFLAEIAPGGTDDPFLKDGIGNIYVSVAKQKNVARGGHFHKKNIENFFTLSGTALWLFIDCRKESSTFNKFYMVILGSTKPSETTIPFYIVDDSKMAQTFIPTGVYHIFWPLTDENVAVLAIASEHLDENDYEKLDPNNYPEIREYLSKFNINWC